MNQSHWVIGAALATAALTGQAGEQANLDLIAMWKDTSNCSAPSKVVSVKAAKLGGQDGVLVTVKLNKSGKVFTSSIQSAKPSDFKAGTGFCAHDFSND